MLRKFFAAATTLSLVAAIGVAQAPNDTPAGATAQFGPGAIADNNGTGNSVVDGPLPTCGNPVDDLWYYYFPTITGLLTVTTSPCAGGSTGNASGMLNGDTVIGAFADAGGGSAGAQLNCDDDGGSNTCGVGFGFESVLSLPVVAGTPIYVSVTAWGVTGNGGAYTVEFTETAAITNDECTGAIVLAGGGAGGATNVGLTNVGASPSSDQGTCYGQLEPDAWFSYTYTGAVDGVVEFSTCSLDCDAGNICGSPGTIGNHNISVWSGSCGGLTQMNCNSQDWRNNFSCNGGQACRTQVNCTVGQTVYVAVAGFLGSQGTFDLHVEEFASAPGNTCANAIPLSGSGTFFVDTTTDGIAPDGFTPSCMNGGTTAMTNGNYVGAWFAWTAPCSGTVQFNTCATTNFFGGNDTAIMVYDNCPLASGVEIACDDNATAAACGPNVQLQSATSFAVIGGNTYYLSCGGWQGDQGPINFTIGFDYKHVWSAPVGVDSIQLENVEGPANAIAFSAITVDILHPGLAPAVNFPNGWFFGVPIGFGELQLEITWPGGLPFTGVLDGCGYLLNFTLPAGTTTGLAGLATIWSVGLGLDPATGFASLADTTIPTAYAL